MPAAFRRSKIVLDRDARPTTPLEHRLRRRRQDAQALDAIQEDVPKARVDSFAYVMALGSAPPLGGEALGGEASGEGRQVPCPS